MYIRIRKKTRIRIPIILRIVLTAHFVFNAVDSRGSSTVTQTITPVPWSQISAQLDPWITSNLMYLQSPYDTKTKIYDSDFTLVRSYFFPGYDYEKYFKSVQWGALSGAKNAPSVVFLRDIYMPALAGAQNKALKLLSGAYFSREAQTVPLLPRTVTLPSRLFYLTNGLWKHLALQL